MRSRTIYLRPSSAAAWFHCRGYAALNAAIEAVPEDEADNEVREDGTACHWLAHEVWLGMTHPIGSISPNKREITEEMHLAVEDYHALLRSWPSAPHLEMTLPVAAIFPGVQDGTPDAWVVSIDTLYVADLKFGFRYVDVWRNLQLIVYAWTLLMMHPHITEVVLTIYQPRVAHPDGPARTWKTTRDELRPIAEALQAAAILAMADDVLCTVNPGCRNCEARMSCKTLAAAAGNGMDVSYDATPHVLTDTQVGYELTKLKQASQHIEHRITGLTAQAESLVRSGKRVPGFTLERAATRWRWREDAVARLIALGRLLGVDVHAPEKLKSVAKLRDSFPGLDVQALYAERPTGELRLKATDPNEAVRAAYMKRN